jgi:hypothetical protein
MAGYYFLTITSTATLFLLGFGGFLLYDSMSNNLASQFGEVMGGAPYDVHPSHGRPCL